MADSVADRGFWNAAPVHGDGKKGRPWHFRSHLGELVCKCLIWKDQCLLGFLSTRKGPGFPCGPAAFGQMVVYLGRLLHSEGPSLANKENNLDG